MIVPKNRTEEETLPTYLAAVFKQLGAVTAVEEEGLVVGDVGAVVRRDGQRKVITFLGLYLDLQLGTQSFDLEKQHTGQQGGQDGERGGPWPPRSS